jgi:cytidylate kinase
MGSQTRGCAESLAMESASPRHPPTYFIEQREYNKFYTIDVNILKIYDLN